VSTNMTRTERDEYQWLLENALKSNQIVIPVSNGEFIRGVFRQFADLAHVTGFPDDPSAIPGNRRWVWGGGHWSDPKIRSHIKPEHNNFFDIGVFDLPVIPPRVGETEIETQVRRGQKVRPARQRSLFKALCYVSIDDVGLPENGGKVTVENALKLGLPSARIETSPGNWQWGYITEFVFDLARAEALLDGLIQNGLSIDGRDPGMKGVTRYQRLPEGSNTKAKHTARNGGIVWRHRVHEWRPDRVYRIEELAARFGIDLDRAVGRAQAEEASMIWPTDAPVVRWLNESGSLIQEDRSEAGKYHIVCPWVHEHTNGDQSGTALWTKIDGSVGFQCHHGHCEGKTAIDFLRETGLIGPHDVWRAFGGLAGVVPGVTGPAAPTQKVPKNTTLLGGSPAGGGALPAPIPPVAMNPESQLPGPNSSPVHAQPEGPFGAVCTPSQKVPENTTLLAGSAAAGGLDFMGTPGGAGGGGFTGPAEAPPGAPAGGGDGDDPAGGTNVAAMIQGLVDQIPAEGIPDPALVSQIVQAIARVGDPLTQGAAVAALKRRTRNRLPAESIDVALLEAQMALREQQPGRERQRTEVQERWAGLEIPQEQLTAENRLARLTAGPGEIRYPFPEDERNPQSIAKPHPLNLQAMLNHYGILVRFNEMTRERYVVFPGFDLAETLKASAAVEVLKGIAGVSNMRVENLAGNLEVLCAMPGNCYHPVVDYLERVKEAYPRDGVDYVDVILNGLVLDVPEGRHEMTHRAVVRIMLHKWLLQCAAAPYNRRDWSLFFRAVLVLVGPQNLGKTSFFKALVPDVDMFCEGVSLDPRNVDSLREALTAWISELGELDGIFRKHDIAVLKAVISKSHDKIREPYAVAANTLPRRTVFCGSVNQSEYLVDETGNTRWWSIKVTGIDLDRLKEYRLDGTLDRMWAQLRHEVDALLTSPDPRDVLPPWVLTRNEADLLAEDIKRFERKAQYEELLEERFNWAAPSEQWRAMTSSEIAEVLGTRMENIKPPGALKHSIERVFARYHVEDREHKQRKVNGTPRRAWRMPPRAPYGLSAAEGDAFRDAMGDDD